MCWETSFWIFNLRSTIFGTTREKHSTNQFARTPWRNTTNVLARKNIMEDNFATFVDRAVFTFIKDWSEGFPNMELSTEYSEAVNARYTFQPLWVSGSTSSYVIWCEPYLGRSNWRLWHKARDVSRVEKGNLRDTYFAKLVNFLLDSKQNYDLTS